MGRLEDKLKSAGRLVGAGVIAGALVLGTPTYNAHAQNKAGYSEVSIPSIRSNMTKRGYMTLDEFQTAVQRIRDAESIDRDGTSIWARKPPQFEVAVSVLSEAITKDLLPHKAMFYLSLENKDYDGAETIRRNWVGNLKYLQNWYSRIPPEQISYNPNTREKIRQQLEKLETIGLTDPMLITLRTEVTNCISKKQWDDALKIQKIITERIKELQASQTSNRTLEEKATNVTIQTQRPSEQYIKVEQMPRYGAEDVGRAISILDGKGGKLDPKAEGTLKLLDILLKR